jgi:hypothetical protein
VAPIAPVRFLVSATVALAMSSRSLPFHNCVVEHGIIAAS